MAGKIYIGTSGWSYKHWRELFYPTTLAPTDYLAYYSQYFDTTEVNTSFYHLPRPETVAQWNSMVKKGFYFCPKISRYITHVKKLNNPGETLPRFFEIFDPFQKRLGPVLIQLPPNLSFNADKVTDFYKALQTYEGYKFSVEARHASWFEQESIHLMKRYRIGFVIGECGKRWPSCEAVTAKHVYIRFHGKTGYDAAYTNRQLRAWARKILNWKEAGKTVWVYFNNDGNGNAIYNAQTLLLMTQGKG